MRKRPIGIFDSGLGGLTVLKEIRKILPGEDIIYFGDTARVPYGAKSRDTVIKFSVQNADFLVGLGVKMIVAACNTSSSFSLPTLRRRYNIPVVGVIGPGAKGAAGATRKLKVGVIGTKATISSDIYKKEIKKINPKIDVIGASCPLFVPLVEEGWLNTDVTEVIARRYLAPLKQKGIDSIVLGCTHYPLLKPVISRIFGKNVSVIDSASQTAKAVKKILDNNGISNNSGQARCRFYVSDEPELFRKIGSRFLGSRINSVKRVEVG
ncbi:MAG: glutamate racemase [Candidatus Omnitrophica bacterium]|nr:glutamate racemase [Candidatus Omnitrophota bacterium]